MVRSDQPLSSPDPLGFSQENTGALPSLKRTENSRLTPTKPLANTSNNVQRQVFNLTTPPANRNNKASPFKLVAEADNTISPWRIRVTVETEQDAAGPSLTSGLPGKRFAERTTTTTVPLRDADEQSPAVAKKVRGRPRKSMDNAEKGLATPKSKAPARRKSNSSQKSGKEGGYRVPTPARRARGRPRKSMEHPAEEPAVRDDERAHSAHEHATDHIPDPRTIPPGNGGKGKEVVSINSTSHVGDGTSDTEFLGVESVEVVDTRDNETSSHSSLEDPTDQHQEFDSILESEEFSMVSVSSLPSAKLDSNIMLEPEMNWKDTNPGNRITSEPSTLDAAGDWKNHTMTSSEVSSPRSSLASPLKLQIPKRDQASLTLSPPTSISPEAKSASRKSRQPLDNLSGGTPKLGRVVRAGIALQGVLDPRNIRSPTAKGPAQVGSSSSPSSAKSPKERLDKLFSGFSAGTMRELRAGLRLGEELAKRQHVLTRQPLAEYTPEDDVFGQDHTTGYPKLSSHNGESGYSLKLPEPIQTSLYPDLANNQLLSPERSDVDIDDDRMSWRVDTPNPLEVQNVRSGYGFRESVGSHDFQGSTAAKEAELRVESASREKSPRLEGAALEEYYRAMRAQEEEEYRAERAAVIKQIEMANSSQVIVVNSDSEEDDEFEDDDGDIWQEQAHSSAAVSEPEEIPAILLLSKDPQPRRSLLPSPWRRQTQVASVSHASTNDSDLFWQPGQMANNTGQSEILDEMIDQGLKSGHSPSQSDIYGNDSKERDAIFETEILTHSRPLSSDICTKIPITIKGPQKGFAAVRDKGKHSETWEPSNTERDNREEYTSQPFTEGIESSVPDSPRKPSPAKSIVKTVAKESLKSSALVHEKSVIRPVSTSWFSYLAGFVPAWREPTPVVPSCLPNGKLKLPRVGSLEGPLSLYGPWRTAHFDALYFHYAASKEGRRHYQFNPKSASAPLLGFVHRHRFWEKAVTKEDLAIVDAFMVDLRARGHSRHVKGNRLIDEKLAAQKVFRLWYGGVLRGECEVGIGKTGLVKGSDEMWTPEVETWYKKM